MKKLKYYKTWLCVITLALITGFFSGCDNIIDNNSTVTTVTVAPATASVEKGGTKEFTAAVTGTNNPAQTVTWSIDETGRKAGTKIDENGKLSVASDETLTRLTIKATSTQDTSKSGTAAVTVTSSITTTVTAVTVVPAAASVEKGGTKEFTATVTGTNNPTQTVTWSIDETGKKAGTVIDENGKLSVASDEALTKFTVKATSTQDTSKSGTAAVTVIPYYTHTPYTPTINTPAEPQPFNDEINAAQLVANIRIGWNLGNTLDANGLTWLGANPTVSDMEKAWVGVVTTKEMIDTIKNKGFNAIRIPVSWAKTADKENYYTIRSDWMKRVAEIVNYAVDNDMYILLNTHHDETIFRFMNVDKDASISVFRKIWEQIAGNFKNYNEKLIFEGLNEPRTPDSSQEWNGGTKEERDNLNEHYQAFVNAVRASGGNNDKRFLMVNPYGASGGAEALGGLIIPTDTVDDRIIVSIHSYAPYNFALNVNSPVNTWSETNSSDTSDIKNPIDNAYNKFVVNGIPVIIGEFGAMNKDNEDTRAKWAEYYVKYAKEKGMPCFWWDNNVFTGNGEKFGLLKRDDKTFPYPLVVEALMKGTK